MTKWFIACVFAVALCASADAQQSDPVTLQAGLNVVAQQRNEAQMRAWSAEVDHAADTAKAAAQIKSLDDERRWLTWWSDQQDIELAASKTRIKALEDQITSAGNVH